jgi:hypothetical protein
VRKGRAARDYRSRYSLSRLPAYVAAELAVLLLRAARVDTCWPAACLLRKATLRVPQLDPRVVFGSEELNQRGRDNRGLDLVGLAG